MQSSPSASPSSLDQDDDLFFNDPELHARLDQVETQFIINSQQQQQHHHHHHHPSPIPTDTYDHHHPPPTKRLKLDPHQAASQIHHSPIVSLGNHQDRYHISNQPSSQPTIDRNLNNLPPLHHPQTTINPTTSSTTIKGTRTIIHQHHPLDRSSSPNPSIQPNPLHQHQSKDSIGALKAELEQIRLALKLSDQEKLRLKGEVSIVRSSLESSKSTSSRQISELKQIERSIRARAERAERELIRIKQQRDLKDTFKGFEENLKRPSSSISFRKSILSSTHPPPSPSPPQPEPPQPSSSPSSPSSSSSPSSPSLATTSNINQNQTHHSNNLNPSVIHHPVIIPHDQPSRDDSPNKPTTTTTTTTSNLERPIQYTRNQSHHHPNSSTHNHDHRPPSIIHSSPIDHPSSHPHHTSHRSKPVDSQPIQNFNLPHHTNHQDQNQPLHSIIIQLFQTFLIDLNRNPTPRSDRSMITINPVPLMQTILRSSQQFADHQTILKDRFDRSIIDLFVCLSRPFDHHHHHHPSNLSSTHPNPHDTHLHRAHDQEAWLLSFVAELSAIFIRIAHSLCHTNLSEAKASSIVILNVLVESSPLFTSYFLNHPDFKKFKSEQEEDDDEDESEGGVEEVGGHEPIDPTGDQLSNYRETNDLMKVLLDYLQQVIHSFERLKDQPQIRIPPRSNRTSPQPHHELYQDWKASSTTLKLSSVHLALLNLIEAIVWDPPEVCYPTLTGFLKSNQSLRFFLIENQPKRNLCKAMNILISLASRYEFSKIILTSQIGVPNHFDWKGALSSTTSQSTTHQTDHQINNQANRKRCSINNKNCKSASSSSMTVEKVKTINEPVVLRPGLVREVLQEKQKEGDQQQQMADSSNHHHHHHQSKKISVIDRLLRILALSMNNAEYLHQLERIKDDGNGTERRKKAFQNQNKALKEEGQRAVKVEDLDLEEIDDERNGWEFNDQLKLMILSLLNQLGIKSTPKSYYSSIEQHPTTTTTTNTITKTKTMIKNNDGKNSTEMIEGGEKISSPPPPTSDHPNLHFSSRPNGFQIILHSSDFLFSILIKLIVLDSYLLWNFDGSIFHKLQIPKCIERIELTIELVSKLIYHDDDNEEQEYYDRDSKGSTIDLMDRLKRESSSFHQLIHDLIQQEQRQSSNITNNNPNSKFLYLGNSSHNIYHEFIISFVKLSFSDLIIHHPSTSNFPQQQLKLQGDVGPSLKTKKNSSSSFRLPSLPSTSNHLLKFSNYLSFDLVNKLDHIGDLAYDLLQSIASPDELDEWRLCSIEEEEEEEDDD